MVGRMLTGVAVALALVVGAGCVSQSKYDKDLAIQRMKAEKAGQEATGLKAQLKKAQDEVMAKDAALAKAKADADVAIAKAKDDAVVAIAKAKAASDETLAKTKAAAEQAIVKMKAEAQTAVAAKEAELKAANEKVADLTKQLEAAKAAPAPAPAPARP